MQISGQVAQLLEAIERTTSSQQDTSSGVQERQMQVVRQLQQPSFVVEHPQNSPQKPHIEFQSLTTGLEKLEDKFMDKAQLTRVWVEESAAAILAVRIHHPRIPAFSNILRCMDGACARRNLALMGLKLCYPEGEK